MSERFRSAKVGRRLLRYVVGGESDPTVVLELGQGMSIESSMGRPFPLGWPKIFREVMQFSQMLMYDRAGVGNSDPAPPPRTSLDMVKDLHALLDELPVSRPYVMVGHSLGGLNVRLYAHMYPQEVGGLVLVDSTHPEQRKAFASIMPPPRRGEAPILRAFRQRLGPHQSSEGFDWDVSEAQVAAAASLGKLPLVVISHSPDYPMGSEVRKELAKRIQNTWSELQKDLLRLSTNARHMVSQCASHNVQVDQPDLVVEAIASVVQEVRTGMHPLH